MCLRFLRKQLQEVNKISYEAISHSGRKIADHWKKSGQEAFEEFFFPLKISVHLTDANI